jgi:hypothetical protein
MPAQCTRLLLVIVLQADLTDPTSLPATLVGISAIIDCATARPEESTQKVDWEGKVALIQCAQVRPLERLCWWPGTLAASVWQCTCLDCSCWVQLSEAQ